MFIHTVGIPFIYIVIYACIFCLVFVSMFSCEAMLNKCALNY